MEIQGVKNVESNNVRKIRVQLDTEYTNGHDYCELIVDEKCNRFTAVLYGGESYTYFWGAPGDSFVKFLIDVFSRKDDYLYEKLADYSKEKFIDGEKTGTHLKKLLLTARRRRIIDKYETQEAWGNIEVLQAETQMTDEHLYDVWNSWFEEMIKHKIISDDPWFVDFIEYQSDQKCEVFCKKVAPILAKVLEQEYQITS